MSRKGVSTVPAKIEAVCNWPTPQHQTDVRAFIGTCSYYRRFIPGYTELARPLNQVTGGQNPNIIWTPRCQSAFERFKEILTEAPILAYPDFTLPFILDTDASSVGTGAVLSQIQNELEKVIAYYSKAMTKEEMNYCVTRRELLAIIKAVKHFRPYLYGRRFKIRSDHAPLFWLLRGSQLRGQLARWMETMAEYDMEFEYRRGLKHNNADGLSRQQCKECKQCKALWEAVEQVEQRQQQPVMKCVKKTPEAVLPYQATERADG